MNLDSIKKDLKSLLDYRNYSQALLITPPLLISAGTSFYYNEPVGGITFLYGAVCLPLGFVPGNIERREAEVQKQRRERWKQFFNQQPSGQYLSREEIEQLPTSLEGFFKILDTEGLPKIVELGSRARLYTPFLVMYAVEAGLEPPNRI